MRRVVSIFILSILFTSAFISCTPEAITTTDEVQTDKDANGSIGNAGGGDDDGDHN